MTTISINQKQLDHFFRREAGADWHLSKTEFNDVLKQQAGADHSFDRQEFMKLGSSLGLSARDSQAVFNHLEHNGSVSVAALRDQMMRYAGKDHSFNLSEFKTGVDHLVHRSERGHNHKIDLFRHADGGKTLDYQDFKALANKAGITDPKEIRKVFNEIAGADHKINKDEMQAAFGSTKMSLAEFKKKFDQIADGHDPSANPPSGSTQPNGSGSTQPGPAGTHPGLSGPGGTTQPGSGGSTHHTHKIDFSHFTAMAKAAGITDLNKIWSVFNLIGGGRDKISGNEMKAAFGTDKPTDAQFSQGFEQVIAQITRKQAPA